MHTEENLWPKIELDIKISNPEKILQEQADFLTEMTQGILVGRVVTSETSMSSDWPVGSKVHSFYITSPRVDGYRYLLFYLVREDLPFYPLYLCYDDSRNKIFSEDHFKDALRDIFRDNKTKQIILSMISQAQAA